jgi:hypothetical protein
VCHGSQVEEERLALEPESAVRKLVETALKLEFRGRRNLGRWGSVQGHVRVGVDADPTRTGAGALVDTGSVRTIVPASRIAVTQDGGRHGIA